MPRYFVSLMLFAQDLRLAVFPDGWRNRDDTLHMRDDYCHGSTLSITIDLGLQAKAGLVIRASRLQG